jgi:hypothetical protein
MWAAAKTFFAANRLAVILGGVLALLAAGLTLYLMGRGDGKAGEVIGQQKREIEVQTKVGNANENSSVARVEDAVRSERQREELDNALKATADPDRARALRGCRILRQQGRDTSGLPACRGS